MAPTKIKKRKSLSAAKQVLQIQFHDANGNDINPGDWLKIICRRAIFYAQFQVKDNRLIPHDTFSWEKLEKIAFEEIPKDAVKRSDDGIYDYYYDNSDDIDNEEAKHSLQYVIHFSMLRDDKYLTIKLAEK